MKKPSASVMRAVRQQARHSKMDAPTEEQRAQPMASVWVPQAGELVMEQILGTRIPTKELRLVIQPNPIHGLRFSCVGVTTIPTQSGIREIPSGCRWFCLAKRRTTNANSRW